MNDATTARKARSPYAPYEGRIVTTFIRQDVLRIIDTHPYVGSMRELHSLYRKEVGSNVSYGQFAKWARFLGIDFPRVLRRIEPPNKE